MEYEKEHLFLMKFHFLKNNGIFKTKKLFKLIKSGYILDDEGIGFFNNKIIQYKLVCNF